MREARDAQVRSPRATAVVRVVLFAAAFCSFFAGASCGGTTGHEDLPSMAADATVDAVAADATQASDGDADAGDIFDAVVQYVDQVLPDVQTMTMTADGGPDATAGGGLPVCAPDIPAELLKDGGIVPIFDGAAAPVTAAPTEVPADFVSDGGEAIALDGSACATQVWLGSEACDTCIRQQWGGSGPWAGSYGTAIMPPCSDMLEAGAAGTGPGAGESRYSLCMALYTCLLTSACVTQQGDLTPCTCTRPMPADCVTEGGVGPCLSAEYAAFELPLTTPYLTFEMNINNVGSGIGHGAGGVNQMFQDMETCTAACFPDAGSGP